MSDPKKNIQEIYPWVVLFLSASFFFYKYFIQVSPSVMTTDLMRAFNIHGVGLGNLSACYFYAYLIMQIPVGILLDKYSPKYLTAAAILICALSTLSFAKVDNITWACISRAFMGIGAAFAGVSCFKVAAVWFPVKRFAFISGLCMTAAMLGAIGGQAPLSLLVENFGWREALEIIAGIGVILSFIYVLTVKDKAKTLPVLTTKKIHPNILRSKQAWLLAAYAGLAFAPISAFGGLWGVPFLQQAYLLSPQHAAFVSSWSFIGFAIGAPLLGWMSDFMGKRKPIMIFGTLLATACLILVLAGQKIPTSLVSICLFLFGLGTSGFFISFSMIKEGFPLWLAATVLGFMNTFSSICEAVTEPVIGALLDFFQHRERLLHVSHQFSATEYQMALLLLPLYLIMALGLLIFIKETYCQNKEFI